MPSITIRNIDEDLKKRLRLQAAQHGRSMEEEIRAILRSALSGRTPEREQTGLDLFNEIRALFAPLGGIELEPLPREPIREPPDFTGPEFRRDDE
jgi:plasmid stability protein